jgi:hypothetical protein
MQPPGFCQEQAALGQEPSLWRTEVVPLLPARADLRLQDDLPGVDFPISTSKRIVTK